VNATVHKETTAQALAQELNPQSHPVEDPGEIMAFQRADPRPFMSPGMIWEDIPNRPLMVRAVASSRPQPRNENVAIATINPHPGNALNFAVVREVPKKRECGDRHDQSSRPGYSTMPPRTGLCDLSLQL